MEAPTQEPDAVHVTFKPDKPPRRFSKGWWHNALIGDYDYKETGRAPPTFFPLDEKMAVLPASVLGLQHCLAMLIGLITPAAIMGNETDDRATKLYMINASMIVAGLMTIVQSSGIKHPRLPFQWGAGTLSVMGISFTTMPIAQAVVPQLKRVYATAHSCGLKYDYFAFGSSAGGSPCNVINNPDAAVGVGAFGGFGPPCIPYCVNEAFDYAWGKLLGTLAFCALIPMFISFMPARRINNLFPPVVIGPVIMLIGISLVGVGFGDWGGGTFCAQRVIHNGFSNNLFSAVVTNDGVEGFTSTDGVTSPKQGSGMHQITLNYDDFGAMYIDGQLLNTSQHFTNATIMVPNNAQQIGNQGGFGTGFATTGSGFFTPFNCNGAGQVFDVYGSAEYVGLGFLTFVTIMAVEVFGSPFMRNCSCIIGLLWGYAAATWSSHGGEPYVTRALMDEAPGITFLWTKDPFFHLSFYPPLIIPFFIVFLITSMETWGDTQASMEASRLDTSGQPLQIMRQKGALLNDTLSGILAALSGVLPLTTFAQNNGVIALTAVASRRAGIACGIWLVTMGVLSKIGAFIQSIPAPVLGGMTTFLFANVLTSGMKILLDDVGGLKRRNRFIVAATFACGIGVTLWPAWAQNNLWPIDGHMKDGSAMGEAKLGVRNAILLILQTGFCFAFFVSFILNLVLPMDRDEPDETVHLHHYADEDSSMPDKEAVAEAVAA